MKWIILLLSLVPSAWSQPPDSGGAQFERLKSWAPQFQTSFCGLNTTQDSSLIQDCESQSLQNVLTDRGYLEERPGMSRLVNQVLSGFPVSQLYEFVNPSNSRFLIAQASTTVYESNLSGSPVAIGTVTSGGNLECAVLSGSIVCDDGSGAMWRWDGVSTTTVNGGAPVCNLLATEYGRMFCGAPSTDLSQVAVSSYPGFGYWTPSNLVPLPANSATSFEFNPNDGDSIQCMKYTPWGLFVGKRNSSYILKGYDNLTFYVQTIDPAIGCSDQRTFQIVNGVATWMSQHGVYQWTGSGPPIWISNNIEPTFNSIRQLSSNSNFWEMQTQGDWQSGSSSLNGSIGSWDTTSSPGNIIPSSVTYFDNFIGNSFSTGTLQSGLSTSSALGLSLTFSSGTAALDTTSPTFYPGANCWSNLGTNYILDYLNYNGGSCSTVSGEVSITTAAASYGTWTSLIAVDSYFQNINSLIWFFVDNTGKYNTTNGYAFFAAGDGNSVFTFGLYRYDSGVTTTLATTGPIGISGGRAECQVVINRDYSGNFTINISSTNIALGGNNCVNSQLTATDNTYFNSSFNSFYAAVPVVSGQPGPPDPVRVYHPSSPFAYYSPTSGLFQSSIFDMKMSTTLAGPFNVAISSPAGTGLKFATRSAPNATGPWTTWASVSTGSIPSNWTQEFFQYESSFTTTLSTVTPSISSFPVIAVSTGIYSSPVHFLTTFPNFTWKSFNVHDLQQSPGEFYYNIRAATYSFVSTATIPTYTTVSNNQNITISTGAYFQWQVYSSSITSSTEAITLANASISKSFVNWQEGTSVKPASGFIDQRYYLCVILSTNDVTNDGCLVYQRNKTWSLFNGPSISAMSQFNFQLIAGDGSSNSRVWYFMQPGIYDDDGSAINSSWVSKDFIIGSPFNSKNYYEVWTDNAYSPGSTLNIGFSMDKNPLFRTKTIFLDNSANTSTQQNTNTVVTRIGSDFTAIGKYIRFKFSQNSLDLPWRLNDYLFYVDVEGRQTQ